MTRAALAHWDAYELEYRLRTGETDPLLRTILPEFQRGKIGGSVFAISGDSREHGCNPDDPLLSAFVFHDRILNEIERAAPKVAVVRSRSDLETVQRSLDRVWFLLALEGCLPLRGEIAVLHAFYRLGVRCICLTWNGRNEVADGVGVESARGLTAFGRTVVAEMNRLGMLIDVSHLAHRGIEDVLEASSSPIAATHSNARALCDHSRNLTNSQIVAVGRRGGMVGVNFLPNFLSFAEATVTDIVRHVHHIASLIGIDRVILGPDFTYEPWRQSIEGGRTYQGVSLRLTQRYPIHRPEGLSRLEDALARSGLNQSEVDGVLGENLIGLLLATLR